ncbi:cation efflux protein [Basidiobolus meristosporus CBS 931.73]|uniref:Cation efflux protein n=1 Tax=Basidiobolus meristosporus CBS 931.73 TaxID=1314790 RepID=A0A1Y1XZ35_9FUNG|nr:cation efflux protein [Basidiobolus meristosporus CBS 931.73]|eukprot:ORX90982.1 cation efflux protein [Basidiobolus meristosporus CBS 931.73]
MALKRTTRLLILLGLTTLLFVTELVVGYVVGSIALVADSFHMLSDLLSIIVALYAMKLAKKKTYQSHYTYGWQRAEVIGALINGVFLIALCLSIFIEAIQRFFEPREIKNPLWVLIVGGLGLLVNLVGLFLFHEHSHIGHSHDEPSPRNIENADSVLEPRMAEGLTDALGIEISNDVTSKIDSQPKQNRDRLNMHGVFLHVLGDALGSIAVIVSSLIIWLTTFPERFVFDPIISLLITGLILYFSIPLVKSTVYILLQGTPRSIPVDELRRKILQISHVVSLHEFHIWQLSDNKTIASVHIHVANSSDYMEVAMEVRSLLHSYGIHSVTIQPEFPQERLAIDTEKVTRQFLGTFTFIEV